MYHELPAVFKGTRPPTNDVSKDLYSFQAANIAATVQLVRMVLFTIMKSSVEEKCGIASEVFRVFHNIPVAYLRAISSQLLHHLTGIGISLGSIFHESLSQSGYSDLRSVLLGFAALISNPEAGMQCTVRMSHSHKLKAQMAALDKDWADLKQQPTSQPLDVQGSTYPPEHQPPSWFRALCFPFSSHR